MPPGGIRNEHIFGICAEFQAKSFPEEMLCEQKKTRSSTNLRFMPLDIIFAFCYDVLNRNKFCGRGLGGCPARSGKILEEL